jgi:hypothetical protein
MLQQHAQAGVDDRTVELIAARVTAALRDDLELLLATFTRRESPTGSLTVEQLAARLSVARSTVYAHWREWGGYKLGSSPKAPIRFNADELPATRGNAADSPAGAARPSQKTSRRRTRRGLIEDAPRLTQLDELLDKHV